MLLQPETKRDYNTPEQRAKSRKRGTDRGRIHRWGLRKLPPIDPDDPLADLMVADHNHVVTSQK